MQVHAIIDASAAQTALLRLGGYPLLSHALAVAHRLSSVSDIFVLSDGDADVQAIAEKWGAKVEPIPNGRRKTSRSTHDVRVELDVSFPFRDPHSIQQAIQKLVDEQLDRVVSTRGTGGTLHSSGDAIPILAHQRHEIGSFTVIRHAARSNPKIGFFEVHPLDTHRVLSADDAAALEPLYTIRGVSFSDPDFAAIDLIAFDFDGVMTDDTVIVREDGIESVIANRGDGMGLLRLKEAQVRAVVISKETNVVVAARCRKLGLPCHHGIDNKIALFKEVAQQEGVTQSRIAFVGNDVNDVECIAWAGCGIAVANSRPEALAVADWVTTQRGGHGAVREICETIIAAKKKSSAAV